MTDKRYHIIALCRAAEKNYDVAIERMAIAYVLNGGEPSGDVEGDALNYLLSLDFIFGRENNASSSAVVTK